MRPLPHRKKEADNNSEDYDNILERLCERLPEEKGITFEEFKNFCMFLNNLDDFQIAMKMYTLADKPISQVSKVIDPGSCFDSLV